jgi:hypothetical protein
MKVIKRSRGRPWVYDLETARSIAALIADGASKKEACEKAGVAYSSFMRWQRENRSLRRSVEKARRMCRDNQRMERDLEVLLSEKATELNIRSHLHNRRPYRDPNAQPVKWMKLIQWWLLHRVPLDMIMTPDIEAAACTRFKIPEWKWEEAKKRFPKLLPKVNQKRLRRMEYALETGKFPTTGWTPLTPRTARHGTYLLTRSSGSIETLGFSAHWFACWGVHLRPLDSLCRRPQTDCPCQLAPPRFRPERGRFRDDWRTPCKIRACRVPFLYPIMEVR